MRQKADIFFSKAKHLLKMNIDVPCLDNIHASILVGNLCGAEAQSATEGIFFGELAILLPDQRLTARMNRDCISHGAHYSFARVKCDRR